jgi:hypothetical protein
MAIYKDKKYLSEFGDKAFDQDNEPGTAAPHRCEGCGREVAANQGQPLPPRITTNMPPIKVQYIGG